MLWEVRLSFLLQRLSFYWNLSLVSRFNGLNTWVVWLFWYSWLGRVKSGQDLPRFMKGTPILKNSYSRSFFAVAVFSARDGVDRKRAVAVVGPQLPMWRQRPAWSVQVSVVHQQPASKYTSYLGNKNRDLFGLNSHLYYFLDYYWWFFMVVIFQVIRLMISFC